MQIKISTYNDQPLSLEDQQSTVHVSVMQQKQSSWIWGKEELVEIIPRRSNTSIFLETAPPRPNEEAPEEIELRVPADGVIPLSIELMDETQTLTVDVSNLWPQTVSQLDVHNSCLSFPLCVQAYFGDSHNTLQLYRRYASPSRSYLQIQSPSAPAEVSTSVC